MKNRTKIDISKLLKEQVLVLDGAMGTAIQDAGLSPSDFGGLQYEGCNEYLNITRPDLIMDIHRAYLEIGVDIVETNSFGSTPLVLAEYGLEDILQLRGVEFDWKEKRNGKHGGKSKKNLVSFIFMFSSQD